LYKEKEGKEFFLLCIIFCVITGEMVKVPTRIIGFLLECKFGLKKICGQIQGPEKPAYNFFFLFFDNFHILRNKSVDILSVAGWWIILDMLICLKLFLASLTLQFAITPLPLCPSVIGKQKSIVANC
jgi:hypothetical protein